MNKTNEPNKNESPPTVLQVVRTNVHLVRTGTDVRILLDGQTELRGRVCRLVDRYTHADVSIASMYDNDVIAFLDNGFYCRCDQLYPEPRTTVLTKTRTGYSRNWQSHT